MRRNGQVSEQDALCRCRCVRSQGERAPERTVDSCDTGRIIPPCAGFACPLDDGNCCTGQQENLERGWGEGEVGDGGGVTRG
eukprot:scaffold20328_cov116-Isochrysis_galbana.AAC.10